MLPTIALMTLLLLFGMGNRACAGHHPQIKSLSGQVELRPTNTTGWKYISSSMPLTGNEEFRVHPGSTIHLLLSHRKGVYFNQNSRFVISRTNNSNAPYHVSIIYGEAFFFDLENRRGTNPQDIVISTNNSRITLSGSSYIIVDSTSKRLKVLAGVANVRLTHLNQRHHLRAPQKIGITKHNTFKSKMLDKDIEMIQDWVPKEIIRSAKQQQLRNLRRDRILLSGQFKDRVLFTSLDNNSEYAGSWNISSGITNHIKTVLEDRFSHMSFAVSDQAQTGDATHRELAKKYQARYVVRGEIQQFDLLKRADISISGDQYTETKETAVRLRVSVYDAGAGRIIYDQFHRSEKSAPIRRTETRQDYENMQFALKNERFKSTLLGETISECISGIIKDLSVIIY
ncbi:FecR domain-containing protein [Chitinispirillales bacterium ANBcel5]|uniref:hypothetical protein n=1 Tax=Cellulosispirillum alkaliphilum TaxID=3039283 RepID=UPI002A52A25E|nr:FecR domain-containing protein [Chitinispirillales bacterium ANBcel5]